ncbi:MAG TPA: hypothetical protein ENH85_15030 [Candidatus Scalindua sp.]|nr:hypothetical protein [Candidatus Scalindua sp.]
MKKNIIGLFVLFAAMQVVGQSGQKPDMVDYFTNNGLSGAVKTVQHPSGEYYKGVTYVAYQGPTEDPYVAAYNHKTAKWTGPFKAGESLLTGKPGKKMFDDHGKPAMIIDDEGYIHLVFGGHGGTQDLGKNTLGNYGRGKMIHVVTKKPMDISEWEELDNISPFGTYNQLVKMDNGDIYLCYRHGAHRSNLVYQLSTDNGRTFAPPVSILKTKQTTGTEENPDIQDSWYAWFDNGQGNDISVIYDYHVCKEPNHDTERHNCYYMVLDTDKNEWRNVEGEILSVPVTKELADEKTLVVDTDTHWAKRGAVRLDKKAYPHIIFYQGEKAGKYMVNKQVIYYRWTGKKWMTAESPELPIATGDIIVSSPKKATLLLAGKINDTPELAWWNTKDGGNSFKKGEVLYKGEKGGIGTSALIRNAHPDARVIIYGNHKGYFRKMYLVGDHGPIKRLKTEADQLDE